MKRHVISLVLCLLTIYTTGSVANTVMFVVEDLGVLPGYEHSMATAVNAGGQVVGVCWNGEEWNWLDASARGFIWQDGVMQDLGTLNGLPNTYAADINVNGQVVGFCYQEYRFSPLYAFLWTAHEGMQPLLLSDSGQGAAWSINDDGHIAGVPEPGYFGALYYADGQTTDIIAGFVPNSMARYINNHDVIVGWKEDTGFVWRDGQLVLVEQPLSRIYCVNDYGQYLGGRAFMETIDAAFIWNVNGLAVSEQGLEPQDIDGCIYGTVRGVSSALFVGSTGTDMNERAARWGKGGYFVGYFDEDTPRNSQWRLVRANSVAKKAGGEYYEFYYAGLGVNPAGQTRAFLLRPPDGPICGDIEHQYPQADLNYDCRVEWADFGIFAANWQCTDCTAGNDWCQGADLGNDGAVGWNDFVAFSLHWQECSAPECD